MFARFCARAAQLWVAKRSYHRDHHQINIIQDPARVSAPPHKEKETSTLDISAQVSWLFATLHLSRELLLLVSLRAQTYTHLCIISIKWIERSLLNLHAATNRYTDIIQHTYTHTHRADLPCAQRIAWQFHLIHTAWLRHHRLPSYPYTYTLICIGGDKSVSEWASNLQLTKLRRFAIEEVGAA